MASLDQPSRADTTLPAGMCGDGASFRARVDIEHVSKSFANVPVVRDICLSARDGEFLSLLGPSGCGKTTLLRMVAGLERQDSGRILLDGHDVSDSPANRRPVGMVFQNYALFPNMTVAENVAFPMRFRRRGIDREEEVKKLLTIVRLSALAHRYPRQLSGGQQQRVSFARALAGAPSLLLLDEPLSALDAQVRQELRIELKALQRETGVTLIYVTHDQEEALSMSDRVALMDQGKIEQIGTPRDLYFAPETIFAASFIGHSNIFAGTLASERFQAADGVSFRVPLSRAGKGSLILRPEMLVVDPHGDIPATVRSVAFLGPAVQVEVIAFGRPMTLRALAGLNPDPGSTISLSVSSGAAFIQET